MHLRVQHYPQGGKVTNNKTKQLESEALRIFIVLYTAENVPYYVNHNTKTTQWQNPNESIKEPAQKPTPVVYDRCEMCTFDNPAGSSACEMCGFKLKSTSSSVSNSASVAEIRPVAPAGFPNACAVY